MFPELFRIGDFPINTYGVLLAVGMLLALFVASRLAGRDGLPRERIYDLGLWTLIGALFGSKILMFLVEDTSIFSLDFLRSGGVYYGGFLGGFFTVVVLVRYYKLNFWKVADALPRLALGQFFGSKAALRRAAAGGNRPIPRSAFILPNTRMSLPAFRFINRTIANYFCTRRSFTNHSRC